MKSRILTWLTTTILVAVTASAALLAEQNKASQEHLDRQHHFKFIDLGTLGGPVSYLTNDPSGGGAASQILTLEL